MKRIIASALLGLTALALLAGCGRSAADREYGRGVTGYEYNYYTGVTMYEYGPGGASGHGYAPGLNGAPIG